MEEIFKEFQEGSEFVPEQAGAVMIRGYPWRPPLLGAKKA